MFLYVMIGLKGNYYLQEISCSNKNYNSEKSLERSSIKGYHSLGNIHATGNEYIARDIVTEMRYTDRNIEM